MGDTATDTSTQDGKTTSGDTSAAGDTFKPITSQAELDARIGDRLARERNKFSDYDDLAAKAARLDEIEEANRSEVERATEKAAQAQAEVEKVPAKVAEQLRTHLIALHDISDEKAELFLTADNPELLLKQVTHLVADESDRKKNGNVSLREGSQDRPATDGKRTFLRELTGAD